MSFESLDEETVWVGSVPSGYCEADVQEELQRHNIPCPVGIKVCKSCKDNQYAFLYYRCRRTAARVIEMGPSSIVWKTTQRYGFFRVFFFTDSFPVLCFTCL